MEIGSTADRDRFPHRSTEMIFKAHEKPLTLRGDLEIYPGQFSASVCGSGLGSNQRDAWDAPERDYHE